MEEVTLERKKDRNGELWNWWPKIRSKVILFLIAFACGFMYEECVNKKEFTASFSGTTVKNKETAIENYTQGKRYHYPSFDLQANNQVNFSQVWIAKNQTDTIAMELYKQRKINDIPDYESKSDLSNTNTNEKQNFHSTTNPETKKSSSLEPLTAQKEDQYSSLQYFDASLILPVPFDSLIESSDTFLESLLGQSVYPREILILISDLSSKSQNINYLNVRKKWENSLSGSCPYKPNEILNIQLKWLEDNDKVYNNDALNRLIPEASYEYVCPFLVSDKMHPNRIESLKNVFLSDQAVDVILHDLIHVNSKDFNAHKLDFSSYYFQGSSNEYDLSLKAVKVQDPFTVLHPSFYSKQMTKIASEQGISPSIHEIFTNSQPLPYFPSKCTIHTTQGTTKNYSISDIFPFANMWPSMKKKAWESHPRCSNTQDKICRNRGDSKQIQDLLNDHNFQVVLLPMKLGIFVK